MSASNVAYGLAQLLRTLVEQEGSDLHLSVGSPPRIRVRGDLLTLDVPSLSPQNSLDLCYSILTEEQKKEFEKNFEIDFAFSIKNLSRFRANVFMQRGTVGGVFRAIPTQVLTLAQLNLPNVVQELCLKPRGLVLVTGPTGSGKSTTLSCMVDFVNSHFPYHIITLEDPVEFVHVHKNSIINQREVGHDTHSFARALRSALRQDPDVILVGEMRDMETIALALTAAETGHLVLGTLHTNSCVASITRLIDVFPSHQQPQIRTQISFSLMGILSQMLVKSVDGKRTVVMETMIPNIAIRNMIREDKLHQVYSAMQMGQEGSHMRTMNQALTDLVQRKKITVGTALEESHDVLELRDILTKAGILSAPASKK